MIDWRCEILLYILTLFPTSLDENRFYLVCVQKSQIQVGKFFGWEENPMVERRSVSESSELAYNSRKPGILETAILFVLPLADLLFTARQQLCQLLSGNG